MLETILFLTINCSFEEKKASDERTGNGNEFEWVVSSEDSRPSEDLTVMDQSLFKGSLADSNRISCSRTPETRFS